MDWNSKTASEWNWENVAGFSAKKIDNPKRVQLLNHKTEGNGGIDNASVYSSGGGGFSGSDLGHGCSSKSSISASADSSLKEGIKTHRTIDGFLKDTVEKKDLTSIESTENVLSLDASASSGEPVIGLRLGKRTYFKDVGTTSIAKSSSFSTVSTAAATTTKRSRASYQSTQPPRCQVEGCDLDLQSAKDYHRRHRICESHSKSPKVIVAGMERRFCQQCSRFHELSEFDDKKRSCRRRLSDHNARRRKPQPEAIQLNPSRPTLSIYDGRQQMNIVLNRPQYPATNSTWRPGDSSIRPAKGGIDRQLNYPCNEVPDATSTIQTDSNNVLSFESSTPRVFSQGLEVSTFTSNLEVAPDLRRALSLLSSTSWSLNEPEPTSLDQLMVINQTSMNQPVMHAEPQNWSHFSSENAQMEQPPLDNSSTHFQEFQLLKVPYASSCFYSNQIN